jgi:hypothetical protein
MIAGAAYYRSFHMLPFMLGVVLTSALNVWRITMLRNAVENAVHMETGKDASNYMRGQYLLRFMALTAVLVAAALVATRSDYMSLLWGAIAGVFTMQIATYSMKVLYKEKKNDTVEPAVTQPQEISAEDI